METPANKDCYTCYTSAQTLTGLATNISASDASIIFPLSWFDVDFLDREIDT